MTNPTINRPVDCPICGERHEAIVVHAEDLICPACAESLSRPVPTRHLGTIRLGDESAP